jgi:Leucine-rich repeat (LRR) protein
MRINLQSFAKEQAMNWRFVFMFVSALVINELARELSAEDAPVRSIVVEESLLNDGEFDITITGDKLAGQNLLENRELQQAAPKTNSLILKKCSLEADIDVILKPFPKVKEISLIECRLTPQANLAKSIRLAELVFFSSDQTPLSDADLGFLARAKKIESLNLPGANLKGAFLDGLANSNSLMYLLLGENQIADEKCIALTTMKSLRRLDLRSNGLSDKAAASFAKCAMLKVLHVEKNKLTDAATPQLAKMAMIEQLNLDENKITARGLEAFRGSKTLRFLTVEHCGIDEAFQEQLRQSFQSAKK